MTAASMRANENRVTILVATMSGTAEMVADEVAAALKTEGWKSRVVRMEKASLALIQDGGILLICSSTYGTGDVPDNGQSLYQTLQTERPDLSDVRYAVIALGDMTYSATFCGGGRKFDELFHALGARRIGERLQHDARSGLFPEDAALAWLRDLMPALAQAGFRSNAGDAVHEPVNSAVKA